MLTIKTKPQPVLPFSNLRPSYTTVSIAGKSLDLHVKLECCSVQAVLPEMECDDVVRSEPCALPVLGLRHPFPSIQCRYWRSYICPDLLSVSVDELCLRGVQTWRNKRVSDCCKLEIDRQVSIPNGVTKSPDKALRSSTGACFMFGEALCGGVTVMHCAVTARGVRIYGLDDGPRHRFGEIRLATLIRMR